MPLSHVYPMPPCSCMALPATSTAALHVYDFAMAAAVEASCRPSATASTAAETSWRETAIATCMSAHACLTAWKEPIGLPNWWRTFA